MKELREEGIHPRNVAKAVSDGSLEKIKRGLYKIKSHSWDEHSDFADVCHASRKAVICLSSAASYHDLTTFNPTKISVAVPHNTPGFKLEYPPIQVYYFPHKFYRTGLMTLKTKSGLVQIYDPEKTICDLFRYRKKLGDDIFIESIKNYLRNRKKDINKLFECATLLGVKEKIFPYVKALV